MNPFLDARAKLVVAHRGNRISAPENTIEAFQQAVSLGADALECDVRISRDGVAVLMHDATVDRTTNESGLVSRYTADELAGLNAAKGFDDRYGKLPVPTLEEMLDRFRDLPLVIEVKEMAAADEVERLVRSFNAVERVVIGSLEEDVMQRFYRSGLACCASFMDIARMMPGSLLGVPPARARYQILSITPRYRWLPVPVERMAAAAQLRGIPTHVWTVNDAPTAERYWGAGVAAIITDDPGAMLRVRPH